MDTSTTEKPPVGPVPFGLERRKEAQQILQLMLKTVQERPYLGNFHVPDAVPVFLVTKNPEDAGRKYQESLFAACRHWGADVQSLAGLDMAEEPGDLQPERLMIVAQMHVPKGRSDYDVQASHMMEACAEVVRTLLAAAIIHAADDAQADPDDKAVVRCRALDVASRINPDTSELQTVCRFTGDVVRRKDQTRSYLLGTEAGQRPFIFDYTLPLAEFGYGPKRIHWLDRRSPGHNLHEQVAAANEAEVRQVMQ